MSFASPLALLGLLFLAPLIWIHLKRSTQQQIAFPTLFILHRIIKQQKKRHRIQQWLIFALRALIIITFVGALAAPSLTVWRPGGIRSGLPISQVIIIDDTVSMQQRMSNGESAFTRAKKLARAELGRLRPQDSVALILAGTSPKTITDGLTTDKEIAALQLDSLRVGYTADAIDDAVTLAETILDQSSSAQKEILFISDLSSPAPKKDTLNNLHSTFRVLGVDTASKPVPNIGIVNIEVIPSGGQKEKEVTILAHVTNFGPQAKKLNIELSLDSKPAAKGVLEIAPKQTAIKKFQHRFENKGSHFGFVKIDSDQLPADNIRYFATNVRRAIHVLVINGDSRPGSYLDESFYLQKALDTPMPGEVPIRTQVMEPEIAQVTPLDSYDVIYIAGADKISAGLGQRLVSYVEEGGGIFIAAGNGEPSIHLQPILPGSPEGFRKSNRKSFFSMGAMDMTHPIFHTLQTDSTGLEEVQITKHILLAPNPSIEKRVLAQFEDGVPILVEREVAKGSTLLLTTTLDRDWTDLPIRPGYLPLIQRCTRYLARSLAHREPKTTDVSTTVTLAVVDGMQKLIVVSPNKKRIVFNANKLADKTKIWFSQTKLPGPYRIWAEIPGFGGLTELHAAAFIVNISANESDLSRKQKSSEQLSRNDKNMYTALKGKLPIWSYLLLAGVFLLLLEATIAGVGLRKSHLR